MKNEMYVAEWNFEQDAPHVQTVSQRNARPFEQNKDWVVVWIGTPEECTKKLQIYAHKNYE